MRQVANNTFNGGLMMDMQPLTTPNTVLTDCLNGTLITYDGNEFVLQSDDGNGKVRGCILPKDYIPLGMKEYGGIIYIASKNPFTGECQIGSFPSPERLIGDVSDPTDNTFKRTINKGDLVSTDSDGNPIYNDVIQELGDMNTILRPGDKFLFIGSEGASGTSLSKICQDLNGTDKRLYNMKLLRMTQSGESEDITDSITLSEVNNDSVIWISKDEFHNAQNLNNLEPFWSVFNNKINGYLVLTLELEQIDDFSLNVSSLSTNNPNNFLLGFDFNSNVSNNSWNNIYGIKIDVKDDTNKSVFTEYMSIDISESDKEDHWNNKLPKDNISTDQCHTQGGLEKNENYTLEVTPYSRFCYFNNLKYTALINFQLLNYGQYSNIWRYYLEKSTNEDITPDKMRITFDFFVRNTLNQRNKLDVIYLEFYDLISGTSLYYPLSSVSDTKTLTINCFKSQEKVTTTIPPSYGNNVTTTASYWLLVDPTKRTAYQNIINSLNPDNVDSLLDSKMEDLRDTKPGYNENKNIPFVYEVTSKFGATQRYNNLCKDGEDFNKLRSNNFYVVAIVGLDFYYNTTTQQIDHREFYAVNYMWTNGIFNAYWNSELYDNFNEISYPIFYQFALNKSEDWVDSTSIANLNTEEDLPNYSYQSYDYQKPYYDLSETSSNTVFNTRIHLDGIIKKSAQITHGFNSNLNYGDLELTWNLTNLVNNEISNNDYNIKEENNYEADENMNTNSGLDTFTSTLSNSEKENSFDVTFGVISDRKVNAGSFTSSLTIAGFEAKTFEETYGNIDVISSKVINIGPAAMHKNAGIALSSSNGYIVHDYTGGDDRGEDEAFVQDKIYPGSSNDSTMLDDYCYVVNNKNNRGYGNYDNYDHIRRKLDSLLVQAQLFRFVPKIYKRDYHGKNTNTTILHLKKENSGASTYNNFCNTWDNGQNDRGILATLGYSYMDAPSGRTDNVAYYTQKHYILYIPGINTKTLTFAGAAYKIENETDFNTVITQLNTNIKNCYVARYNSAKEQPAIIPTNIIYHNNFNTVFNISKSLGNINVTKAQIKINNQYLKDILNNLLSNLSSDIPDFDNNPTQNIINIGKMINYDQLCIPYMTDYSTELLFEDSYTINYNKFVLNNQTINTIVNVLNNPQSTITNTPDSSDYVDCLYPDAYTASHPSLENCYKYYRYQAGKGLYHITNSYDETNVICFGSSETEARNEGEIAMGYAQIIGNSTVEYITESGTKNTRRLFDFTSAVRSNVLANGYNEVQAE